MHMPKYIFINAFFRISVEKIDFIELSFYYVSVGA